MTKKKSPLQTSIPAEIKGNSFPRNLTKLTDDEIMMPMRFYLSLPMIELRFRQDIARQQVGHAADQIVARNNPVADLGLINLEITQAMLHVAVDRLAFPDDQPEDMLTQVRDMIAAYTKDTNKWIASANARRLRGDGK